MANHCFDVICLECGRYWCERGCTGGRVGTKGLKKRQSYAAAKNLKTFRINGNIPMYCKCGNRDMYRFFYMPISNKKRTSSSTGRA